ncbi:apelin receptor early endogenous ligand [Perca flavescens]|uniref:apelin receptor early endogenous ligand n=1 Tax=Perca flavescens TaxID=8167 RepID=UPI00106E18F2|nr:apelin receptor early endogenous ligand [Perca flavescens]
MRVFNLLYLLLLLVAIVASVSSAPVSSGRPGKHPKTFHIQMSRLVGQVSVRIVHSHLKPSFYGLNTARNFNRVLNRCTAVPSVKKPTFRRGERFLSEEREDVLYLRRKYHRHHYCPHRRCMPLHSRVPFP